MNEILDNIIAAIAVVGLFVGIIVEVVKRTETVTKRYLPLVSVIIGMITGFVLAIAFNQDVATYVAAGFIGGAVASGVYDLLNKSIGGNK